MKRIYLTIISALLLTLTDLGAEPVLHAPPQYVGPPLPRQAVTNRAFTGISSMAVAPNGRLWATWYAGPSPSEDHNNYVVLSTSGDGGKNWKELLVVDPDGDGLRRTFDPEVWISPDGKLRWFWCDRKMPYKNVETDALWMIVVDDPNAEDSKWNSPVYVTKGVMMCKPLVLSTGEWALPVCTWYSEESSKMVVSSDQGKSWSVRGGATIPKKERCFDEHMFIERKDGSFKVYSRTRHGISEAVSTDRGKTWSPLEPSSIQHPSARFFISRLNSGNLLLVKHGPIDKKIGRSHLTAFISTDDGKSWGGGFMLDARKSVSYPDGQQTADGTIYITYDYKRTSDRNIFFATFREEDVIAGKDVSKNVRLRQVISKATGGMPKKDIGKPKPVKDNADGAKLDRKSPGTWKCSKTFILKKQSKLFSDRSYALSETPATLKGAKFLRVKMNGAKSLICNKAGMLYVLTPTPDRNKDSVTKELKEQGFQKVALPEVRLFDRKNPGNYCTLYQKSCTAGETIKFGKWALPIFFEK